MSSRKSVYKNTSLKISPLKTVQCCLHGRNTAFKKTKPGGHTATSCWDYKHLLTSRSSQSSLKQNLPPALARGQVHSSIPIDEQFLGTSPLRQTPSGQLLSGPLTYLEQSTLISGIFWRLEVRPFAKSQPSTKEQET